MKRAKRKIDWKGFAKTSWSVSWPMTFIMFFEFVMNMTDIFVAGRIGKEVQASVGMAFQVYFFFTIAGYAITVGAVSVISRLFSGTDRNAFRSAVYSATITAAAAGLVLGVLGNVLSPLVMENLNIPDPVKEYGVPLLRIYALGMFFHLMLVNSNGILRACRMVRTSMITMFIVACCNVFLTIYLSLYTSLGFRGLALSTAISVTIGFFINLIHMIRLMEGSRVFSFPLVKKIVSVGWPMSVTAISWQLGSTVLYLILAALPDRNVEILAAFSAGNRIESMVYLPAFAFNMANAVIIGNYLGERKAGMAFRAGLSTAAMGVAVVSFMTAVVMMLGSSIAPLLSKNSIVIDETIRYIYVSLLSEPFMALSMILGGAMNGAGDTRGIMKINVTCLWGIRIASAYLFGVYYGYGAIAVWWSMNASLIVQSVLMARRYYGKKWLRIR